MTNTKKTPPLMDNGRRKTVAIKMSQHHVEVQIKMSIERDSNPNTCAVPTTLIDINPGSNWLYKLWHRSIGPNFKFVEERIGVNTLCRRTFSFFLMAAPAVLERLLSLRERSPLVSVLDSSAQSARPLLSLL